MNKEFRIILISNNPYNMGLLKGYCHAHRYTIFEATTDLESINSVIQMQPQLVILAVDMTQDQAKVINLKLLREMSINYEIPVCYLHDSNNVSTAEEVACWVDAILDIPLDVNQLDGYLQSRFKHHHYFIKEKRSRERRSTNDRRMLMLEQPNEVADNNFSSNDCIPKNDDAGCFIVDPFQIDQRSKSVLYNGKLLNLTRKEYELFELLAKDVDRVFMTDEIINHLWPENNRATKSDLYQYMHLLRKKIENDPNNPQWILTVKGFGYKLNVASSAELN